MKLKNNALQELYDTLVSSIGTVSPYVDSPVDKAFRECDEKLSESITFEHIKKLENDNDILKRANEILISDNMESISKEKKLKKEIDGLHKHMDILSANEREALSASKKLEKDLDDAKKNVEYFRHSRDDWRSRAKHAEEEVSGANKQIKALKELNSEITSKNIDLASRNVELARKNELLEAKVLETTETLEKVNSDRNSYHGLYTELRKDYDKLFEDNRKLKARTDCLRYEVEWYRKHYKEKSDKIGELKKQLGELTSQYQKLTIENKRLQNNVRTGYDQGQTDLWVKLQDVNDSQPFELATCFPDVTGMEDILNWDLEDFLDVYKKWWEEKEKDRLDHMRDYLARFCEGRLCKGCPLESNEFKCGYGYSFRKFADDDWKVIPDEELERYYEKASGCGRYTLKNGKLFVHDLSRPMAGVNEAIKNACERFTKDVEAANINISTRAWHGDATAEKIKIEPWSCTLEGTINVEFDRDLLEKVCGVKPDDKK